MKHLISFIGLLFFSILTTFGQVNKTTASKKKTVDSVQTEQMKKENITTEKFPEYPGGIEELYHFLRANLVYPKKAQMLGIEGIVLVEFAIEKDGTVGRTRVVSSLYPDCDEEALRIVQIMPNWIPAESDGTPVACIFQIPVQFALMGKTTESQKGIKKGRGKLK